MYGMLLKMYCIISINGLKHIGRFVYITIAIMFNITNKLVAKMKKNQEITSKIILYS